MIRRSEDIENRTDGDRIAAFCDRFVVRAATLDERMSDDFEPLKGQKRDADLAATRLAAWCRSSASGDWRLFGRRLARDGLTFDQVLSRLATVRRGSDGAAPPLWTSDAVWIEATLQRGAVAKGVGSINHAETCAFEQLHWPVVQKAEALLEAAVGALALTKLTESARACLRSSLLNELSSLCALAIYERFAKSRKDEQRASETAQAHGASATAHYDRFVACMKEGGFGQLFDDKPVLLRLIASITRQWIETSSEFVVRLDADLATIGRDIIPLSAAGIVAIEGDRSDRHHNGRSVLIASFEDQSRVVYKPKDLRLDVAWHALVERLNRTTGAPIDLKAPRAIARDGYGWAEFIEHTGCTDGEGCRRFFRRAGAWLALFHCFAATDMHQENIIAAGEHPVPIDLEMILQGTAAKNTVQDPEAEATIAAREILSSSVMMVGLLPLYARSPKNTVFSMGGLTAGWEDPSKLAWHDINSDAMRPVISKAAAKSNSNLPHVEGRYAKFGDYIEDFIAGFEDYAKFLSRVGQGAARGILFDGFDGLPVRKVIRPTRFYHMLLQRLKNHRTMDDGVIWSAQADFLARMANWDSDDDPLWSMQRSERAALLALNVPHFVNSGGGVEFGRATDTSIGRELNSGLDVARARVEGLDEQEIAWQVEILRQNTGSATTLAAPMAVAFEQHKHSPSGQAGASENEAFVAEADRIAGELSRYAIRRGPGAAWIGLDWLGDAEVFQLAGLGQDLYNGVAGIAVFLAAHAAITGSSSSAELALAAVSHLRKNLKSQNAARWARSMGVGAAIGLGSIVYALCVMSRCLQNGDLLADALKAAELFTDELIAADKLLDVMGGSAGGILGLIRLYRDTQSADVLKRAIKCGEHLLAQPRLGPDGARSWVGQGFGSHALNGMSHGAAGFAYALAALSAASARPEFAHAAAECVAFENSSYDAERKNWPDFRNMTGPAWPCRWCHGAPGIGLARIATAKTAVLDGKRLNADIGNALQGAAQCPNGEVDTLCCGTLGRIEFLCEAGRSLDRPDLRRLASQSLMAIMKQAAQTDYRWNSGKRQFNLGLFRGLSGVGYTLLRQVGPSLPNILIWE
jgi:type 2 lantibiotic biosynthesis protein LanM